MQPPGLRVHCVNRIPHARGLGSSSAAIVAGLVAARAAVEGGEKRLSDAELLALATELEGHPDNVAACLYGGLTIAWQNADGALAAPIRPAASLRPVVFVPPTKSSTAKVRKLLPEQVPHADAARNAGRAALLVHALTAAPGLLLPATEDWLHQSYRAEAMPRSATLVGTLREAGVPAVISGAGPTVLAFAPEGIDLSQHAPRGWVSHEVQVDLGGAQLLPLDS
jgi:homoserine kinase